MATLRLFAGLREAAGTSTVNIPGTTVGEVLDGAAAKFGATFESGLQSAQTWVNGQPADRTSSVDEGDEVALIPPVSGGAVTLEPSTQAYQAVLVLSLLGAIFIANFVSLQTFVFVVVGAGLAWLWDLSDTAKLRGLGITIVPTLIGVALGANGAYRWGFGGFAAAIALAFVFTLVWTIFNPATRQLDLIGNSAFLGLIAAIGAGSIVLIRMRTEEELAAYLAIAAAAGLATWAAEKYGAAIPWLNSNVATLAAALGAGLVASVFVDNLTVTVMLLGAGAVAIGLIAGRALGSIIRTGAVAHTERAPGLLTVFDGPAVAVGMFWLVLIVFG